MKRVEIESSSLLDFPPELHSVIFSKLPIWQVFLFKFCCKRARDCVLDFAKQKAHLTKRVSKHNIGVLVARFGYKNILEWVLFYQKLDVVDIVNIVRAATINDHLEIVEWLYPAYLEQLKERAYQIIFETPMSYYHKQVNLLYNVCCKYSSEKVLTWLLGHVNIQLNLEECFTIACKFGNAHVMELIFSKDSKCSLQPINKKLLEYSLLAIRSNNLESVKWLKENGFDWDFMLEYKITRVNEITDEMKIWVKDNHKHNFCFADATMTHL
jgi:hypothetical protein